MDLNAELTELAWLKERAKRSEDIADERKRIFKAREAELFTTMDRLGLRSVSTDDHTFTPRTTVLSTITDMDAFVAWCEETGQMDDYVKNVQQKARLNELVRERYDNMEELPPGVNSVIREYISTTER